MQQSSEAMIVLATTPDPTVRGLLVRADGSLTGFGKEVDYLPRAGYRYDSTTGKMVKK